MKIRPKNIQKFQLGGSSLPLAPNWYTSNYRYHSLGDWNLRLNKNAATAQLKDHSQASNLNTAYSKNMAYIETPEAVGQDIQSFYNSDASDMSAEEFVKFYNDSAAKIRGYWDKEQFYNNSYSPETAAHNQLFRRMFKNRSTEGTNINSDYDIGYQTNLEGRNGSNTWLRRMDRYETKFDPLNPNGRVFTIRKRDGSTFQVYKEKNGDIGLLTADMGINAGTKPAEPQDNTEGIIRLNTPPSNDNKPVQVTPQKQNVDIRIGNGSGSDVPEDKKDKGTKWKDFWTSIGNGLKGQVPNILEDVRLAGSLINNERIYNEALKGIRPNLHQTYNTYRQVVGDEATKQAYYRRAAAGQTSANIARTSDMDRQMAYSMEARAQADRLRAEGDLIDNQRIRETSELSSQHADANRQRATQIANENIDQFNAANQAKHNLLAQKYAANWTSWDNFLKGRIYRYRQREAEEKAINDQIQVLKRYNKLETDKQLQDLYQQLEAAYAKPENQKSYGTYTGIDYNSREIKGLQQQIKARQRQLAIESLEEQRQGLFFAKSGTKITYKKRDDLLYKSTRDAVEHFRKMVKLTDDSYQKSRKKTPKLVPHPTKKLQQGGVAPFLVYTPTVMGGETSMTSQAVSGGTSSSTSSGTNKDSSGKDLITLVQKLFTEVDGLPVDVSAIYGPTMNLLDRVRYGGEELSTSEIATLYLQAMQQLSYVKYHKKTFDDAKAEAIQNDSLEDFAIAPGGMFVVQNMETGKLLTKKWDSIDRESEVPITNHQLLNMRATNPNEAFSSNYSYIVQGSVGINKVTDEIKKLAESIGTTELEEQGFTKKEASNISEGLKQLLQDVPDGIYKISTKTKSQQQQIDSALNYIMKSLPNNMLNTLKAYSDMRGTVPEQLIMNGLVARQNILLTNEITPITGKGAKDSGDQISSDKINTNPLIAMQREIGGTPVRYNLVTRDSNTRMSVSGTNYSSLPKIKENMSIDKMLSESGLDGILEGSKYGITFGDQQINPSNLKDIMYYNSGDNVIATLPCKIVNGQKQVNLHIIDLYEEAEQAALQRTGGDRQSDNFKSILGEELRSRHLDSLLDANGFPNRDMFAQFLVVEGYTTDKVPIENKDSKYIEKIRNPDENLEKMISEALSTDDKKSNYSLDVDDKWFLEFGYDDIYRGTVFIPLTNNLNAALNSYGTSLKMDQQQDLEELYQIANKSSKYNSDNSLN